MYRMECNRGQSLANTKWEGVVCREQAWMVVSERAGWCTVCAATGRDCCVE